MKKSTTTGLATSAKLNAETPLVKAGQPRVTVGLAPSQVHLGERGEIGRDGDAGRHRDRQGAPARSLAAVLESASAAAMATVWAPDAPEAGVPQTLRGSVPR